MHILIAILGVLGVAAVWWYRIKFMSEAATEVADAVGRVQGQFRRSKLRKKAAIAPVTAIDDPVTAAATVILAIAAEDAPVTPPMEESLRAAIAGIADPKKIDEAVVYAKWATDQVAEVTTVIDQTSAFLAGRLSDAEKEELIGMVDTVSAGYDRHHMYRQRVERLRRKLGLPVNSG